MSNEELVEQIRNGYYVTENMQVLYEKNLPLIRKGLSGNRLSHTIVST